MFYPDIETVRIYAKQYTRVPVYMRIPYDGKDVVSIYAACRGPYSFLLESGEQTYHGRYSIIALPCKKRLLVKDNISYVYGSSKQTISKQNPMTYLESLMKEDSPIYPELPLFTGGAIGHFNYDVIRLYENLPDTNSGDDIPLMQFGFVKDLIVIDHQKKDVYFISNMDTSQIEKQYADAKKQIKHMYEQYQNAPTYVAQNIQVHNLKSNYTKDAFMNMVEKAKSHIYQGDIFQVVLSQRIQGSYTQDPLSAYARMRTSGSSPYMYYLDFDTYTIAGASPELLLQARGDQIRTIPIAGTRKRGKNAHEDMQLKTDLQQDPKENAEHMMLVDLGRNDIGRVAEPGSVQVSHLKEIQLYSHVMHMTSEVNGTLRKDKTIFDALGSLLPAGTLSGAPKVRAMEIIDTLENARRGIYGGAIGFLGSNGQFDTCITIRTMLFHNQTVSIQAGAGIVKDSDPQKEYEETLHKAAVLLSALGKEIPQ